MNKQVILSKAKTLLQQKQLELMAMLTDLNDGLANDTKSSAGDKYETSRAMSQQEIDKVAVQLRETKRQLALLPLLESKASTPAIENGSLVKTKASCFYIGLPIGRLEVENELVYCISPTAPIAQKLLGLKVDDPCEMAGAFHKILEIL
jgi:hypothetical protein